MQSKAETVAEYIKTLPKERKDAVIKLRKVILKNLPKGYEESMQLGMIGYTVPLKSHSNTYNKQPLAYASIASQKNHMSIYLMNIYSDKKTANWFVKEFKKTGKKLNMGKCCIRLKKIEDLPIELIGKAIAKKPVKEFIEKYELSRKR